MHPNTVKGLKRWAKEKPTKEIAEHLVDNGVEAEDGDEPRALAVWIRKQAIGDEQFKRNQAKARWAKKYR